MELIENQPGKSAPGRSVQSQIPPLPTKSPSPALHQPSQQLPHQPPQPIRVEAVDLKRRREQKGKGRGRYWKILSDPGGRGSTSC